jgi:hypothetical protein
MSLASFCSSVERSAPSVDLNNLVLIPIGKDEIAAVRVKVGISGQVDKMLRVPGSTNPLVCGYDALISLTVYLIDLVAHSSDTPGFVGYL